MAAIEVKEIVKNYGEITALDKMSLQVEEGEIFGLIGPDGAGKTSLIRILTTLLLADSGQAYVQGLDVIRNYKQLRTMLGYMPGRFSLYQDLSVEENLQLFAALFGTTIRENYDIVKPIYSQLEPFKSRRAGALSGGMKQKLALSCALIHKPEVLFLDEPTTGVDPVSRKEFWEMLKNLQSQGLTILVSTPYMDEAELCDRIALMQNGRLLSVNTPEGIKSEFTKPIFAVQGANQYRILRDLRNYVMADSAFSFGESIHFTDKREKSAKDELEQYLHSKGHKEFKVSRINAGIEDCFMSLMQETER